LRCLRDRGDAQIGQRFGAIRLRRARLHQRDTQATVGQGARQRGAYHAAADNDDVVLFAIG